MALEVCCCKKCKKWRVIFYDDMCQTCYKKNTKEKKENAKYIKTKESNSLIINKIISLFLDEGKSRKEIYNIINKYYNHQCSYRYICCVIQKHTQNINEVKKK